MNNYEDQVLKTAMDTKLRESRMAGAFVATVPYTPIDLCREIFSKIPLIAKRRLSAKIAVLFTVEMAVQLNKWGFTDVTLVTDVHCDKSQNIAVLNGFAYKTVEQIKEMKFDVVVGNPPYQATNVDGERKSKKDNLWSRFLALSLDITRDGGWVSLIHPGSWMSPASGKVGGSLLDKVFKTYDLHYLNVDGARWFPGIGVGLLTWYSLQKSSSDIETKIATPSGDVIVDLAKLPFIPTMVTPETLHIVSKFFGNETTFVHSTELNTYDKKKTYFSKTETVEYCHVNKHTGAQVLYSNVAHSRASDIKVMIPLSGYPTATVDAGVMGVSHVVMFRVMTSLVEAEVWASVCNSKLYQFMLKICKWSGFNSKRVVEILPLVDLTRSWTDAELYAHFNLTQEEIDLIEATV